MTQRVIYTGTTSAEATKQEFTLQGSDFKYGRPIISVDGLAGAETLSLWKKVGDNWVPVSDSAGTQTAFTATYCSDVINGPGTFGITKDATAGAIVVYVDSAVG